MLMTALLFSFLIDQTHTSNAKENQCPKTMNEETDNQLKTDSHPSLEVLDGKIFGVRHGHPGFRWDTPHLTLVRTDMLAPGNPVPDDHCVYVEERPPKNNHILFRHTQK